MIWEHSMTLVKKGKREEKKRIRMRNFSEELADCFLENILSNFYFFLSSSSLHFFFFFFFFLVSSPGSPTNLAVVVLMLVTTTSVTSNLFLFYFWLTGNEQDKFQQRKANPKYTQKSLYPQSKQAHLFVTKRLKNCYNSLYTIYTCCYNFN